MSTGKPQSIGQRQPPSVQRRARSQGRRVLALKPRLKPEGKVDVWSQTTTRAPSSRAAMSGLGQRSRPWPGDPASSTPSEPAAAVAAAADARGESSTLRDFGTSMDAISFGFAATAILISLFLLMAIFEHLIKPRAFPPESPDGGRSRAVRHRPGRSPGKLRSAPMVESVLQAADLSVLMPGQRYPTYLAQPAPLPPSCPREGVHWPPHDHHGSYMPP